MFESPHGERECEQECRDVEGRTDFHNSSVEHALSESPDTNREREEDDADVPLPLCRRSYWNTTGPLQGDDANRDMDPCSSSESDALPESPDADRKSEEDGPDAPQTHSRRSYWNVIT